MQIKEKIETKPCIELVEGKQDYLIRDLSNSIRVGTSREGQSGNIGNLVTLSGLGVMNGGGKGKTCSWTF